MSTALSRTRKARTPRPPTEYSQLLDTVQKAGLMKRRYGYYAVKSSLMVLATAGIVVGMILLAIAGFSSSNAMATANTLVQTVASDALRGRVMAVYMTVFAGTTPFGALISGAIANRYGVATAVWFGGAVTLLAALALAWTQRQRLQSSPPMTVQVS